MLAVAVTNVGDERMKSALVGWPSHLLASLVQVLAGLVPDDSVFV